MKQLHSLFALVDCNNFYASCEKLFEPGLEGRPVVVLSNNDGCIIARSNEAKKLGIKMGVPAFEIAEVLEKNDVAVFSTNYTLYGDVSQRVMTVLQQFTPTLEVYSIDEAFLELTGIAGLEPQRYGEQIVRTVMKWTGIPVSVGIASTKTLAKLANDLAKEHPESGDMMVLLDEQTIDHQLRSISVSQVWGMGAQHTKLLEKHGVLTACDLKHVNEKWIRQHMGVMGERTVFELRGISCYPVDDHPQAKKGICTSRSFGRPVEAYDDLEEATTTFASSVAEKLRRQRSVAQSLTVFVMTNRFAQGPHYVNGMTVELPVATNHTAELIHHVRIILKKLFRKGYLYKKSGVIVNDIISQKTLQCTLWDDRNREKQEKITGAIDRINQRMGKGTVRYAVQGSGRKWKMRQEKLSPKYTTSWEELLVIGVGEKVIHSH
ncbi:MAG: Y-family DNA polymerase [Bacteroidales bacterium]|nr:Y-family DNA polymerase [Lentimicrobiaceae bacterium]MDD5694758.1 Y-family DNA polymerase [Bacteroidales bacterium]